MRLPRRLSCVLLTSWRFPRNHFCPGAQHPLPSIGKACYFENALEMLSQPGEWYLDPAQWRAFLLPRAGEDLAQAEVVAPRVQKTLIAVTGLRERPVRNLHFNGIRLAYVDYPLPDAGHFGIWDCQQLIARTARLLYDSNGSIQQCDLNMPVVAASAMEGSRTSVAWAYPARWHR